VPRVERAGVLLLAATLGVAVPAALALTLVLRAAANAPMGARTRLAAVAKPDAANRERRGRDCVGDVSASAADAVGEVAVTAAAVLGGGSGGPMGATACASDCDRSRAEDAPVFAAFIAAAADAVAEPGAGTTGVAAAELRGATSRGSTGAVAAEEPAEPAPWALAGEPHPEPVEDAHAASAPALVP